MRILVTAFEPFGGEDINPTSLIIDSLYDVDTLLLPVSFVKAPESTIQRIKNSAPDAVILLGQAGGRAEVSLERIAVNVAHAKNPDNDGFRPIDLPVCENGPDAYLCKLPLMEIRDLIRLSGIPCHISDSAGAFVCNALFYSVMHSFPELPVVFMHVPFSPKQAVNKKSSTPSMNVADMTMAVNVTISYIKQYCSSMSGDTPQPPAPY